jgi:hypothetical protein
VLALLTHTVLALDVLPESRVVERNANFRVGVQDGGFRKLVAEPFLELFPRPAASLTPPPELPPPHAQHFSSKSFQSLLVARHPMVLKISTNHCLEPLPRVFG